MSAILLSNLLGALVINDSDSWEKADSVGQKVSDLAEAIEHSGLNPDVRQEMLKHLFMIESLRDISTPKHGVAEGVASGEPTTKEDLGYLIINTSMPNLITLTNTVTGVFESIPVTKFNLTTASYAIRKLGFDLSPLASVDTMDALQTALYNHNVQFINE
jgi:hypothetical protein